MGKGGRVPMSASYGLCSVPLSASYSLCAGPPRRPSPGSTAKANCLVLCTRWVPRCSRIWARGWWVLQGA